MSSGRTFLTAFGVCALGALGPVSAQAADAIPDYVTAAINDPGRPPNQIARDHHLKPAETIAFSGMKPGDKVVDLIPRDGYYTRIFSTLVGPSGHVYPFVPIVGTSEQLRAREEAMIKAGKQPPPRPVNAVLAVQDIAKYNNVTVIWEMLWQIDTGEQFGLPEQVDVVWSVNGYHELHNMPQGPTDDTPLNVEAVDKAIFRAIKPGGAFVIVDHAAKPGAGIGATRTLHRTDPDAAKAELMSAGFTFDGESNVLDNPADDRTQPMTEANEDSAAEILLRFRKPTTTTGDKRPIDDPLAGYYGNTSIGARGTPGERRVFYHPDHTYQEFGLHDMQSGTTFWNADGNSCMLHQFPAAQRNFVVCHAKPAHKVGDVWTNKNALGETHESTIISGYHPLPDLNAED